MIACCVIWSSYLCVSSASRFLSGVQPERASSGIYSGGGCRQQVPMGLVNLRMFSFCPCIWRVLSPDGEFWVDRFYSLPQHFKDVVPVVFCSPLIFGFSGVMTVCPDIVFSLFILFWFCWTSWICYSYVFHQIWGFGHSFFKYFSVLALVSSLEDHLLLLRRFPKALFILSNLYL